MGSAGRWEGPDARVGDTAGASLTADLEALEQGQWTAMTLDAQWRVSWVSPALQRFLGETDPAALGYGLNLLEACLLPAWLRTIDGDSMPRLIRDVGPFILGDLADQGVAPEDVVPADLLPLFADLRPAPPPGVFRTSFRYADPDGIEELGGYTVKSLVIAMRRTAENDGGWIVILDIDVAPRLVALLARGDPDMYERMARLVQPGQRAAAILFCDLEGSGTLARTLPTAQYFRLVRTLWTAIDATVARNCGIVGKHAGDGATAFFLADDLGGESPAARAAVLTARQIHTVSSEVFHDVADRDCLMKVGIHWGSALYMGQLVPGGRLDVTALGDEVNEAARVQEAAGAHETLASKQLLERLSAEDAADLGVDPDHVVYQLLADLAPQREKVVRDAGTVAVTPV